MNGAGLRDHLIVLHDGKQHMKFSQAALCVDQNNVSWVMGSADAALEC
jgi:hypothetical protein